DYAVAVLVRRHRRAHAPRAFDRLRAERKRDADALGTRHAEIDIGERPLLAIALVVDGEVAILQADLGEVAPVQAAGVEALDPSQQRGEVGNAVACGRARARARSGGMTGAAEAAAAARSTFAGGDACAGTTGGSMAEAVTNGRLLLPAKIVTLLSDSMRTAISAPTKLSRSARMRPASRPAPEIPTSALGALATMVPSASRTTMSRMRSDVRRLLASRSIWVPPISTSWPGPKFSF